MTGVVIIGGGLSGLTAAYTLERAGIPYTLIEVKGRLGGSILSERRGPVVFDGGPFILRQDQLWPLLVDLGLADALFPVADLPSGAHLVAFRNGTAALVDALAARLTGGRIITRMAVSTLGALDGRFSVCLENGLLLHADALIVAAPARYAERLFYPFVPEISDRLRAFHYDNITRVSLTLPTEQIELPILGLPDPGFAFGRWTTSPHRVPPGQVLVQVGLRYRPAADVDGAAVLDSLCASMGWPRAAITAWRVDHWPESHLLWTHEHSATMDAIESLLPPGVALIGSDYRAAQVEARLYHAEAAARAIGAHLLSTR